MSGVITSPAEALRPYVEGEGAQYFGDGAALFEGVAVHETRIDVADGGLDFIVAGPEWWTAENPVALAHEWRRCLREGGRLAALVEPGNASPVAIMRFLATECGLEMERPVPTDDGAFVLVGARNAERCLRRYFSHVAFEVTRADRPEGWRTEFWFDLATVLLQAGEGQKAAEAFGIVVAEDPDSIEARVGLAMAMALLADWDEAEAILTEVLNTDPDHGLAAEWLRRCRARSEAQDADKSVLQPVHPKGSRVAPNK